MTWLIIAIISYMIMAGANLVDKHLLKSSLPNPKVYSFYIGILFLLVLVLAPFVGFYIPPLLQVLLALAAGATFVFGLLWFYKALNAFDASRVVPIVGGMTPLITFGLVYLASGGKENITLAGFIAFLFLVLGSVLMVYEKNKKFHFQSFKISIASAFLFSLSFVLVKYVYLAVPFWTAFIWRCLGGALVAICFAVIFPEVRAEVKRIFSFQKRGKTSAGTALVFFLNQSASAGAAILQNWALFLVPLAYVAYVNALQGVQYVFLVIFSIILSVKFPKFLKEEMSKKLIAQKIAAILIIGVGLAILAIK